MNLSYNHKYTFMLYVHQPVSKRETSPLTKKNTAVFSVRTSTGSNVVI